MRVRVIVKVRKTWLVSFGASMRVVGVGKFGYKKTMHIAPVVVRNQGREAEGDVSY